MNFEIDPSHVDEILYTNRLILRPMSEEDASMVVKWRNSEHVSGMSRLSANTEISLESHLNWFRKTRHNRIDYIFCLKESKQPLGSLSYTLLDTEDYGYSGLSGRYLGEKQFEGQGYAFEASKKWVSFGFDTLKLECVMGYTKESNAVNRFYNKKLGFKEESFPNEIDPNETGWIFMRLTKDERNKKNERSK